MTIRHYRLPVLIIVAVISLVFVYLVPPENYIIKSFFRVVAMGVILYYAFLQVPSKLKAIHILILIGLSFSIIGDSIYYWPMFGFLIAPAAILDGYIFYCIGFFTQIKFSLLRLLTIIPIAIFGYAIVPIIFKSLDDNGKVLLIFAIIIYILFIAIMCWAAFMTGNRWVMIAALLFVISDTVRVLNKHIFSVDYLDLLIILSYYGAQFLIAHSVGTFTHKSKKIHPK